MPKVITGTWQNPDGSAVANGTLFLKLSLDAVAFGTAQLAPTIVAIQLDATGSIPANTSVYGNDEVIPNGTGYFTTVIQKGGGKVYGPDLLFLTGSGPISLNNFTPQGTRIVIFNQQIFTVNGTFTIPAGITSAKVTVVGAGGAGGGGTAANAPGSGGGGGGISIKWLSGLTPGNNLTVTIGVGGTGVSGAAGNNGTQSSVSSGTQVITSIIAGGGLGGNASAGIPGVGGTTGSGGDINEYGSAGYLGNGGAISGNGGQGPIGGSTVGVSGNTAGFAATLGGGGSGGGGFAGNTTGGTGGNGVVIFEWVQ